MIIDFEHDVLLLGCASETGARSKIRKPAFSGGFSWVLGVYDDCYGSNADRRDLTRESPVVVVVVVRVLEANIAERG